MKRIVGMGVALLLFCATQARAETFEDVVKDQIKVMKQVTEALVPIKDEATAKDAKPKLEKLTTERRDVERRGRALGKPSKEDLEVIKKKYGEEIKGVSVKLGGELMRIAKNPDALKVLKDLPFFGGKPAPKDKPVDKPV